MAKNKNVFEVDNAEDSTRESTVEVSEKKVKELSKNEQATENFTNDQKMLLAKYIRKGKITMEQAIEKVLRPDSKPVIAKAKAKIVKNELTEQEKHFFLCRLMSKGKTTMTEAVIQVYGKNSDEHKAHLARVEEANKLEEAKV